jgi:hypothetical protein
MRRPAQHHLRPGLAAAHGLSLLTDPHAFAVLANSDDGQGGGGGQPAQPPVPSPADLATRNQPPQPAPAAPAPGGDDEDKVHLTQRRLNVLMKAEKDEGRRAALRQFAEAAGLDPDSVDPDKLGQMLKDAQTARQAQLTEEQRRAEALEQREKDLEARAVQLKQQAAEAARRDRDTRIRSALVRLGATGDDLEDAAALLRIPDDATDEQITQAAQQLKERRGVLFGSVAPQTLPPAPSGGPAGGNAPRQPSGTKDAVREAARKRARDMGLRTDDAA